MSYLTKLTRSSKVVRKIAIVGSGPTGFTLTKNLLNANIPGLQVHLIDRLPVPYGLIRYGVAPDHLDIKDCTNRPEQKLDDYHERSSHDYLFKQEFKFFGNLNITHGKNVKHDGPTFPLETLLKSYDLVGITSGAGDKARALNIPGEDLNHVMTSLQVTGWYNTHPYYIKNGQFQLKHRPNLSKVKNVVIIGLGNVALDVARILAMNTDNAHLEYSDIDPEVYNQLKSSAVENIYIVGRKGPLDFKGTRKEVKELVERTRDLANISVLDHVPDDNPLTDQDKNKMTADEYAIAKVDKQLDSHPLFYDDDKFNALKKQARTNLKLRGPFRTYAYLRGLARAEFEEPNILYDKTEEPEPEEYGDVQKFTRLPDKKRHVQFRFHRSPVEITSENVKFRLGKSNEFENIPADLVILCTGNELSGWENLTDYVNGEIPTFKHSEIDNLYFGGWARTGSKGVVNNSIGEAQVLSKLMLTEIDKIDPNERNLEEHFDEFINANLENGQDDQYITNWEDWQKIRKLERQYGHDNGFHRVKVQNVDDMKMWLENPEKVDNFVKERICKT